MGVSVGKGTRRNVGTVEEIAARVTEREELMEILTSIAFSDIRDFLEYQNVGTRAKRLTDIDPVKLHALKTYRADETRRSFCIRLHDKGKALAMLLKLTGEQRSRGT